MKLLKNNRGLTLVELLISIALVSLVALLITSLQLFGQNQVKHQTEQADLQAEVRLALNVITKDIRGADYVNIVDNTLTINGGTIIKQEGTNITRDGNVIASKIQHFYIEESLGKVDIELISITPRQGKPIEQTTTIYLRE